MEEQGAPQGMPQGIPQGIPSGNLVTAVADEVKLIVKEFRASRVCQQIKPFEGNPRDFKTWIRNLDRAKLTLDLSDNKAKLLAFETSQGYISDSIERHLKILEKSGELESWDLFKSGLQKKFAEVINPAHAMTVLRGTKQQRGESVALFAEKLISLAKDAYGDTLPTLPRESYTLIDLQVVAVFSDGLNDKAIRARVIRGKPQNMDDAIKLATEEQSFRKMLGYGSYNEMGSEPEPMEIDHLRRAKCFECGHIGHRAKHCPNERGHRARVEEVNKFQCWNCGSEEHLRRDCDKPLRYKPRVFNGPNDHQPNMLRAPPRENFNQNN